MTDPLADLGRLEGVPSAIAAAVAAVDAVLRDRGLRKVEPQALADAAWMSARAGVELAESSVDGGDDARGEAAAGTVRLLAEVPQQAELFGRAPGQVMARLHALWGRGQLDDDALGRLRDDPAAAERLAALQRLLAGPTTAAALVVAAVVHAELWTLDPFPRGSWAVALGCEQAVLVRTGVDPYGVIPLAAGHVAVGDHAAALTGYASGTASGMRAWLLHEAAAVSRAAELAPVPRPPRRRTAG